MPISITVDLIIVCKEMSPNNNYGSQSCKGICHQLRMCKHFCLLRSSSTIGNERSHKLVGYGSRGDFTEMVKVVTAV